MGKRRRLGLLGRVSPSRGLSVAFLGVDGAGKSTLMARVEQDLAPYFRRVKSYRTRPLSLPFRLLERYRTRPHLGEHDHRGTLIIDPHVEPPRGLAYSLGKLGYWWLDYALFGYVLEVLPRLARSSLVLFDRYYDDVLVDPRRYRYGGPLWMARLVGRLVPKPHMVFLLDVPLEVALSRKREVAPEEVARQRTVYLRLVGDAPNGHVLDASKPLEEVVAEARRTILAYAGERQIAGQGHEVIRDG